MGGFQQCKDWGSGGQFKVCEIQCNSGLKFSQPVPKFYTCGAEGFWRPTENPVLPLVYPACSGEFINNPHLVLTMYKNKIVLCISLSDVAVKMLKGTLQFEELQ